MKILFIALAILLALLQYKLWFEKGGVKHVWFLQSDIHDQQKENDQLRQRNAAMEAEVTDLKQGTQAVEEHARADLGMVKKNEQFYQVVSGAR